MAPPILLRGPPSLYRPTTTTSGGKPSRPENLSSIPKHLKNPNLDLFFRNPNNISRSNFLELLKKAYTHNPLTTLKLIVNLRYTGDSEFLSALVWLHRNHPLTLAFNINTFTKFGSLQLLLRILEGILDSGQGEQDIDNKLKKAKRVVEKYELDSSFRLLHNKISQIFADSLRLDIRCLNSGEINKISHASRFCPSLDSHYDKFTLICDGIARKLFPKDDSNTESSDANYAFRVRDRLRKEVLVPLRNATLTLNLESRNSKKNESLKKNEKKLFNLYQRNYQKLFTDNDMERSRIYANVAYMYYYRIRGSTVRYVPHEIVASLSDKSNLTWRELVKNLSKTKSRNSIAICRVSDDMEDTDIDFCTSMALIIADLNKEPWKNKVLTINFGTPKNITVEGEDLRSRLNFMKKIECDKRIQFSKVLEELLRVALKENVASDQGMVKRIYVFTDIGFEEAANNIWGVWAYAKSYRSKGFAELPEIVFWNLRRGVESGVVQRHKGLVMVNGISKPMVSMLLEKDVLLSKAEVDSVGVPSPENLMNLALCGDVYND